MAKNPCYIAVRQESRIAAIPAPKIRIFYHRKIEFTENFSHCRYLGYGTFTKKLLATIPEDILIRSTNHGVNRYKIMPEFLP